MTENPSRSEFNSHGLLIHAYPEGLINFWGWFGDSKVVDQDGRPKVVYHGTNANIAEFDFSLLGCSVDNPTTQFGMFFSEDADDAVYWANRAVERGRAIASQNVIPVYLSLKNPVELPAETFNYYLQVARSGTIKRHLDNWKNGGHDGIITVRSGKRWIVAFSPEQIKSAIGNSGLFLKHCPSLTDIVDELRHAPRRASL